MSMNVGSCKDAVKSDINVTPLVDVMLVLLIIMMIVAPLLTGAGVKLPMAVNTAAKPETPDQTVVAVDKTDRYFVNNLPVRREELRQAVEAILETRQERIILIKADENARYAAVMDAMDELRAGGIEDMGLVTEPRSRQGLLGGGGH